MCSLLYVDIISDSLYAKAPNKLRILNFQFNFEPLENEFRYTTHTNTHPVVEKVKKKNNK